MFRNSALVALAVAAASIAATIEAQAGIVAQCATACAGQDKRAQCISACREDALRRQGRQAVIKQEDVFDIQKIERETSGGGGGRGGRN